MLKRGIADSIVPVVDWIIAPLVFAAAALMKLVRRLGIWRMPACKAIFNRVGIYPIRDHYYEPMFNYPAHLYHSLREERHLPGIDMNAAAQLALLARFDYAEELMRLPRTPVDKTSFYYNNPNFSEGDAEYYYSLIRLYKPGRIIEIGSGFSTMLAREAVAQNQREDAAYRCRHICVEPYEMGWLDGVSGIEVLRQKVEQMDKQLFLELEMNDILFIDSSHVIRPQGDVLCEYLEILPVLKSGVLTHIHDIFTPLDYLDHWLIGEVKMWNEQYLLEAFLSCNTQFESSFSKSGGISSFEVVSRFDFPEIFCKTIMCYHHFLRSYAFLSCNTQFEIIAALNFLSYHHPDKLAEKFPMLRENAEHPEPRSFWIRKVV